MEYVEYLSNLKTNQVVDDVNFLSMLVDNNYIFGFDTENKKLKPTTIYYTYNGILLSTNSFCYPHVLSGEGSIENPCTQYSVNWDEEFYLCDRKFRVVDERLMLMAC